MDPTIPRGRSVPVVYGPIIGRLVWKGENNVILAEDGGGWWPAGTYSIVQGFADGHTELPRPWRYNEDTGDVVVAGDMVLIDFLRANWRCPVVRGVVRKIGEDDPDLVYDYRAGHIGNLRTLSIRRIDTDGNESGAVRVRMLDEDGSVSVEITDGELSVTVGGNLTIEVDGDVSIHATGDATVEADGDATVKAAGTATVDGSSIVLGAGATEGASLGTTLETWLSTHTHPYVDTPIGASVTSPPAPGPIGITSTTVKVRG